MPPTTLSEEQVAKIARHAAIEAVRHVHSASPDEMSRIALAAAKEAVREQNSEFFALLGVNIADFEDVKKLRSDLEFLSSLRTTTSSAKSRAVIVIISAIILVLLSIFGDGAKHLLGLSK